MVTVEIEYSVPCGRLDPAVETARELLEFGRDVDGGRLQTGHGGVFRVSVGDELVFDTAEHGGQIDVDRIIAAVERQVPADGYPSTAIRIDGIIRDWPRYQPRQR